MESILLLFSCSDPVWPSSCEGLLVGKGLGGCHYRMLQNPGKDIHKLHILLSHHGRSSGGLASRLLKASWKVLGVGISPAERG